jgi:hypothetical protein
MDACLLAVLIKNKAAQPNCHYLMTSHLSRAITKIKEYKFRGKKRA